MSHKGFSLKAAMKVLQSVSRLIETLVNNWRDVYLGSGGPEQITAHAANIDRACLWAQRNVPRGWPRRLAAEAILKYDSVLQRFMAAQLKDKDRHPHTSTHRNAFWQNYRPLNILNLNDVVRYEITGSAFTP